MFNFIKELFKRPDIGALLSEGALIVDVRTAKEFKSGHIEKALNIPVNNIERKARYLSDKGKPIVLYCQSGMRSRVATKMLKSKGVDAINGGSLFAMQRVISKL